MLSDIKGGGDPVQELCEQTKSTSLYPTTMACCNE